jgi:hypothetical protein
MKITDVLQVMLKYLYTELCVQHAKSKQVRKCASHPNKNNYTLALTPHFYPPSIMLPRQLLVVRPSSAAAPQRHHPLPVRRALHYDTA